MSTKQFLYRFSDGTEWWMEPNMRNREWRQEYCRDHNVTLEYDGFVDQLDSLQLLRANSHSKGDGFKPGFHPGLGMEIRTNEQYQQILKEKGLVETGGEQRKEKPVEKPDIGGVVIEEARKLGVELSGREIDKIAGKID